MKLLVNIKNKIEDLYIQHTAIAGYVTRLVFVFAVMMVLRSNAGFNLILTNIFFVIGFSFFCAFVPARAMVLLVTAYLVVQIFFLSSGTGIAACFLLFIMCLVYFRFVPNSEYVMLLIPVLCMIRLPILIPLVLAATAPAGSSICVALGVIAYYFIKYI